MDWNYSVQSYNTIKSVPLPVHIYRVGDELLEVDGVSVLEKTVEEVKSELQRILLNEQETLRIVAITPSKHASTS